MADEELVRLARGHAPDAYLSALLAPRALRPDLIALAAFLGDVERIVATVSDPGLAEIRLHWWREAIAGAARGERTGNPAADALGEAVRRHDLPFAAFDGLLDARALDLYADPIASEVVLDAYLDNADGAPLRLAARCLGSTHPESSRLITAAARACGITRLLRNLPVFLARGRAPFPGVDATDRAALAAMVAARRSAARDRLAAARVAWRTASAAERRACLPLAVVEGYLKATERPGHDPARMLADVEPLDRIWRLWVAHIRGHVGA